MALHQVCSTYSAFLHQIGCMTIAPLFWSLDTAAFLGPPSFFFVFGPYGLTETVSPSKLTHPNQQLLKVCVAKALEYHVLTASFKVPCARLRRNAKWDKPPPDWHKLNTNASIIHSHAGASSLFRDSNGNGVQGFSKPLGTTTILMAELWALNEGLHMARQLIYIIL